MSIRQYYELRAAEKASDLSHRLRLFFSKSYLENRSYYQSMGQLWLALTAVVVGAIFFALVHAKFRMLLMAKIGSSSSVSLFLGLMGLYLLTAIVSKVSAHFDELNSFREFQKMLEAESLFFPRVPAIRWGDRETIVLTDLKELDVVPLAAFRAQQGSASIVALGSKPSLSSTVVHVDFKAKRKTANI
ncbi:MAG: hypothetical protein EOP06_02705 [Proteobacteria bacterium]|nr:MAG: hypothetical protein EOP06_02705 [Pseudomonadota bacterium]